MMLPECLVSVRLSNLARLRRSSRFVADSLLEERGFEPSVPPQGGRRAAAEGRWIPIITKSVRGELSLQRRPPVAPRRRLVVGVCEAQHRRVAEALADDLERQRQAAVGITA